MQGRQSIVLALLAALFFGPNLALQADCPRKAAPAFCDCCHEANSAASSESCCGISKEGGGVPLPLDRTSVVESKSLVCPSAISPFSLVHLKAGALPAPRPEENHSPPPLALGCILLI
jgi:hypothetical protein